MSDKDTSDQQLVIAFKKADTKQYAYYQIITKYQEKVYWVIRKMVIDHDDANDLTQEVFIKVWNKLAQFRGESGLYTWIYKIATNECLSFLRKKSKRFFVPILDVKSELLKKIDQASHIDGDQIQIALQKALLKLPDQQRLVFNLRYFEEMPFKDIAKITGKSEGGLKANYHHAMKKIEEFMKSY